MGKYAVLEALDVNKFVVSKYNKEKIDKKKQHFSMNFVDVYCIKTYINKYIHLSIKDFYNFTPFPTIVS